MTSKVSETQNLDLNKYKVDSNKSQTSSSSNSASIFNKSNNNNTGKSGSADIGGMLSGKTKNKPENTPKPAQKTETKSQATPKPAQKTNITAQKADNTSKKTETTSQGAQKTTPKAENTSSKPNTNQPQKPTVKTSKEQTQALNSIIKSHNAAQKAFDKQMKDDGWAGDFADGVSALWGSDNRASKVREDLKQSKQNVNELTKAAQQGDTQFKSKFKDIYGVDYNQKAINEYNKNPSAENYKKAFGTKQKDISSRVDNYNKSQQTGAAVVKTTAKIGAGVAIGVATGGTGLVAVGAAALGTAAASAAIEETDRMKIGKAVTEGKVEFREGTDHKQILKDAAWDGAAVLAGSAVAKGATAIAKGSKAVKAAATVAGDVATGAAQEKLQTGDVTLTGTMINATMSGVGSAAEAGLLKKGYQALKSGAKKAANNVSDGMNNAKARFTPGKAKADVPAAKTNTNIAGKAEVNSPSPKSTAGVATKTGVNEPSPESTAGVKDKPMTEVSKGNTQSEVRSPAQLVEEYSKGKNLVDMTDNELTDYYKKFIPDINKEELTCLTDQVHRLKNGEPRWQNNEEERHLLRGIQEKLNKNQRAQGITWNSPKYDVAKNKTADIPFTQRDDLTDYEKYQLRAWYNKGEKECIEPIFDNVGTVLDHDVDLYRCVTVRAENPIPIQQKQCDFLNSIKEGGTISNANKYTSTAKDPNRILNYGMTYGQSYMLKVRVPKGTKVLDMRNFKENVDEIVLPPSSYKINKIDYTTGIVECDFVPASTNSTRPTYDRNGNVVAGGLFGGDNKPSSSGGLFNRIKSAVGIEPSGMKALKARNPENYQMATSRGLTDAVDSGKVSQRIYSDLQKDPGNVVSKKMLNALDMERQGKTLVTTLDRGTPLSQISRHVGDGQVCSVNGRLYVNDNGTAVPINMSQSKFEKLFPPTGTAMAYQPGGNVCPIVSQLNTMMDSAQGRVALYKRFEQRGNDVYVHLEGREKPIRFPDGKPVNAPGARLGENAAPGLEMLNQAVLVQDMRGGGRVSNIADLSTETLEREAGDLKHSFNGASKALGLEYPKDGIISRYGLKSESPTWRADVERELRTFRPGKDTMGVVWEAHARSVVDYNPRTKTVTYHDPYNGGVDTQCSLDEFTNMAAYLYHRKATPSRTSSNPVNNPSISPENSVASRHTTHASSTQTPKFTPRVTELANKPYVVARTADGNPIGAAVTNINVILIKNGQRTLVPIPEPGVKVPVYEQSTGNYLIIENKNGKVTVTTSETANV